jgi:phosphoglycerol transferase
MQDEYVYSMQSRKVPLTESEFPNFLYSWLYSSTNACGINYYSCSKNLNLVFFAGFVGLVFWLSIRFLNKWWALAISLATALSPLRIFTAVFMPESMYFFFALASLVALWWASKSSTWWHYSLAGVLLGLTSLVKPHALFLIAAAVLYLLIIRWSSWKAFAAQAVNFVATTIASKLVVGVFLAGPNGFTLFGTGYTNSVTNFTENLTSLGAPESSLAAALVPMAASTGFSLTSFLSQAFFQLGWQLAAVSLLALAPLVAILMRLRFAKADTSSGDKGARSTELQRLALLLVLSLATMVGVISAFAAMVTVSGDDHSNRILLRYYEFLIPALTVVSIALLGSDAKQKVNLLRVIGAGLLLLTAGIGLGWTEPASQMIADSSYRFAFTALGDLAPLLLIAAALGAALAFARGSKAQLGFGLVVLISMAFIGNAGQDRLYNQAGFLSPIDSAGIFARDYLAQEEGATIFYAGVNKQLTLASIFWVDKPGVQYQLFSPGQQVTEADLPEGTKWVVLVSGVDLAADQLYQVTAEGFTIARVGEPTEHRFDQQMQNSPLADFDGLEPKSAMGSLNSEAEVRIRFTDALPALAKLRVTVVPNDKALGQITSFSIGDSTLEVQFEQPGMPAVLDLEFGNLGGEQELVVQAPGPGSLWLQSIELVK